jgi:hypothetical protein
MSECPTTTVSQEDDVSDNEEEVDEEEHGDREAMTCNALCSLGSSGIDSKSQLWGEETGCFGEKASSSHKCCPKQLQLPMFLSSTYFAIARPVPKYRFAQSTDLLAAVSLFRNISHD